MEQLMIDALPVGYLPCANPHLVDEYVRIEKILAGSSSDFDHCDECDLSLCDHALNEKREDESYKVLVEHFRNGGMINQPICWRNGYQSNGHHRLVAAHDAGFTYIPVNHTKWGVHDSWEGTEASIAECGFKLVHGDLYAV